MAYIRNLLNESTEEWERTKPGIFSEKAMNSLSMRLNGEEEMNKEKWVCLCVVDEFLINPEFLGGTFKVSWLANKLDSLSCLDNDMKSAGAAPPDLTCYGCAIWKSCKIIIAGGKYKGKPSDKVFIYDVISKRGDKPTVVVVADDAMVFVFGGHPQDGCDDDMDDNCDQREIWAEFCHLHHTRPWKYLHPENRVPRHMGLPHIRSHAVYPREAQILFWSDFYDGVFLFDYNQGAWHKFEQHHQINQGPQWSSTVVVFEDFLFWHHCGTIYAHDLLVPLTLPLYTLSRTDLFSTDYTIQPTFLVHVSKGKLCLFCWAKKNRIWYCTFLVQISHGVLGPPVLHIVPGQAGFLKGASSVGDIKHALEISS